MRLTEKYEDFDSNDIYCEKPIIKHRVVDHSTDYEEKLGQYEDIEEELGIDLVTLIKALKNGVYYKYKPYGYDYLISKCRECRLTGKRTLVVDRHTYKYLCDYGKTWALTREELL